MKVNHPEHEIVMNEDSDFSLGAQEESYEVEFIEDELQENCGSIEFDNWEKIQNPEEVKCMILPEKPEGELIISKEITESPSALFEYIFDENFFSLLTIETNRYFMQSCHKYSNSREWKLATPEKMKAFLGILLLMCLNKRNGLYDHFSDNSLIKSVVKNFINRNDFSHLWRYFHLNNNKFQTTPSCKIKHTIEFLVKKWKTLYKPAQNLTVDESMIAYRGKTKYMQYEPLKPTKFGLKAWTLAESYSGYMLDFILYEGKSNKKKSKLGEEVVKQLIKPYINSNHILFVDSFYTSPNLCRILYNNGIGFIGMVNANKYKLDELSNNLEYGESDYFVNNEILYVAWKDKKKVSLLSTIQNTNEELVNKYNKKIKKMDKIRKPQLVISYSRNMKGVDINNMMSSFFEFDYRCSKWWKPVFMRLINISITNIYILHRKFSSLPVSKFDHKKFILSIIEHLLSKYSWKYKKREIDFKNLLLLKYERKKRRKCIDCKKLEKKRTDTYFYCRICHLENKIFHTVCESCFNLYHIKNHELN